MSLPRVPKMEQRVRKTQALEALTHLRPLLRARRNHKKYLQNGFFSGLLVPDQSNVPNRNLKCRRCIRLQGEGETFFFDI
jgi:hypothetical protein